MEKNMEKVKQNKQTFLYGGGLFILVIAITTIIATIGSRGEKEQALPSGKETEIESATKEVAESEQSLSNESADRWSGH